MRYAEIRKEADEAAKKKEALLDEIHVAIKSPETSPEVKKHLEELLTQIKESMNGKGAP